MRRIVVLLSIISLFLLAVISPGTILAQTPTQTPNKIAVFWDMGIKLGFPANWSEPQIITGQMYLTPPGQPNDNPVKQPFVALRIFDPIRDLGLTKDATSEKIAAAFAYSGGQDATITLSNATTFAGLEAWLLQLDSQVKLSDTETIDIRGQVISFLLPDGRYGAFVGNAPSDQWGDFLIIQSAMTTSASLVLPSDFTLPVITNQTSSFPQGGTQFAIPDNWKDQEEQGVDARTYFDKSLTLYSDSGLANGPTLQVIAVPFPDGGKLENALTSFLGSPLPLKKVTIAGSISAIEATTIHPSNWQTFVFVAFLSQDGKVMNVFRWTVPGMLIDRTRPTLNTILASIKLIPVVSSTPSGTPTAPTSLNVVPPDYASLQGITVTTTADGAPMLGAPDAVVRLIDYMDYDYQPCSVLSLMMHQFITSYM